MTLKGYSGAVRAANLYPKGKSGEETQTLNTAAQFGRGVTLKGYSGAARAAEPFSLKASWGEET